MTTIGRHVSKLSGYAPALPTPFDDVGDIDSAAFDKFCGCQIREGATALVVCGTTGETATLSPAEHRTLIRIAAGVSGGRVPVIAGAGSNSTNHAVELTQDAQACGADAILSVVPYYNKPTQIGLYEHFRAIAQSTALPIILYDVPSRTACGLADETVVRLAEMPQIIGLKDATGDVTRPARLRPRVGPDFRLLSGDDATAMAFLAQGGDGCISVTSNVVPGLCRNMFLAYRRGHMPRATRLANPLSRVTSALFRETNPVPLKYALSLLGLMSPRVRLPLVELTEETKAEVAVVVGQMRDDYSDCVVGHLGGPMRRGYRALTGLSAAMWAASGSSSRRSPGTVGSEKQRPCR
jgi:4-hydroxy-tetrahydrodipicolinate synthase